MDSPVRIEYPKLPRDERCPLAFFIPAVWMKDEASSAPLAQVARLLQDEGYATCSYAFPEGEYSERIVKDTFELYRQALDSSRIDPDRTLLVGFCEGADFIARAYYDFFEIQRPAAAILLSPTLQALHLNNLTCAYLLIHGSEDPQFRHMPYVRYSDAVHHHQMRYGDATTAYLVQGVGVSLSSDVADGLDLKVLGQIRFWIHTALENGRLQRSA